MNKVIHLSLARKSVPVYFDVVQATTAPAIDFIIDDWTPPASARARIYIKKDGGEIYNNCTLSGNVVTYTPTAGSFDVVGECYAQLDLLQSTTVAVSWPIVVTVAPNYITGSAAPASTEFGALTALIQNAQQYDTVIGANNEVGAGGYLGWTSLTTGQDLNTITDVGIYVAHTDTIAGSLLNCPSPGVFKMIVEYIRRDGRLMQTVIRAGATHWGWVWSRTSTDGGATWGEWLMNPTRAEVNAITNQGAKNLLLYGNDTVVHQGITFIRNSDGSVTANGTATGNANYYFATRTSNFFYLPRGTYRLTGCPEGGSLQTYYIAYARGTSSSTAGRDLGAGVTITENNEINNYGVWIVIIEGQTVNNLTFYPMIMDAGLQDRTYEPFALDNAALTKKIYKMPLDNADLNNVEAEGVYYSSSSTATASITNRPNGISNGFVMQVWSERVNRIQVIYESGLSPAIFIRSRTSGGWGAWKKTTLEDA